MASPPPDLESRKQQWYERYRVTESELNQAAILEPFQNLSLGVRDRVSEPLRQLRTDGYQFANDLENEADELARQVQSLETGVALAAHRGVDDLSWRASQLVDSFRQLDHAYGDVAAVLDRLGADLENLSQEKDRLKQQIGKELGNLPQRASMLATRIAELRQHVDRGKDACFSFHSNEGLYLAVQAEWKKTGVKRDDPDGILYVTNLRLIMERKEKVGGFLGFGGKRVQEVAWELPLVGCRRCGGRTAGPDGHRRLDPLSIEARLGSQCSAGHGGGERRSRCG